MFCAITIIAVVVGISHLTDLLKARSILSEGMPAHAVVDGKQITNQGRYALGLLQYRYVVSGNTFQGEYPVNMSIFNKVHEGDEIQISYNQNTPHISAYLPRDEVRRQELNLVPCALLLVIGFVFI